MNNPTPSLPVVSDYTSTYDPTDRQDQSTPRKKSRIDTTSTDPRCRGRGYTGRRRGRPVGALNKPKVPEDDQPKLPKKKGRPVGAKNKAPRRTRTPRSPAPTDDRSPVNGGSPQPPPPQAQHPFVLHPNVLPEAVRTYRAPDEYIPYGYVPAEQTLPARHPHPDDFFTNIFNDPPAAPSPSNAPNFFEDVGPVPDFGNPLPSSMSPEENNNFAIDPALLNSQYDPNGPTFFHNEYTPNVRATFNDQYVPTGPAVFNNHNNNSSSSSSDDIEVRASRVLQAAKLRNWDIPLGELNHDKEDDFSAI